MAGPETEEERARMVEALRREMHPDMKLTPEEPEPYLVRLGDEVEGG